MKVSVIVAWGLLACGWLAGQCPAAPGEAPAAGDETPDKANEQAIEKALTAADAWLKLVDAGNYGESWDAAAEYLRGAVSKDQLVKSLDGARKPLAQLKERKVKSKEFRTTLPGAPDGKYVIIHYETSFENKQSAIETVTPMLDKDGTWRVSGYYIK